MGKIKKKIQIKLEQLKGAREARDKIKDDIKQESKTIPRLRDRKRFRARSASNYDEICRMYGRKVYSKCVPKRIRQQSLSNMINEGRFMDIVDIHGEETFEELMPYMMLQDIKHESKSTGQQISGVLKTYLPQKLKVFLPHSIKRSIKKNVLPVGMALLMAPAAFLSVGSIKKKTSEKEKYQAEITEYLEDVKSYGEQVRQYDLTPIQTLMKVTSDMWERIDGYGTPEIDLLEYGGIDVSKPMGVGVCRNMADDCARRLNAIDEKWNARVIPVYFVDGGYQAANITIKKVYREDEIDLSSDESENKNETEQKSNETETKSNEDNKEIVSVEVGKKKIISLDQEDIDKFIENHIIDKVGNHAVVLVDVPEDDVTLVYDPTNAGIGLYYNGQIKMFNSYGETHPLEMKTTIYGDYVFGLGKALIEKPHNIISSIGIYTDSKIKELNDKYGVSAQNQAIEDAKKISKSDYQEELKVDGSYMVNIKEDNREKADETSNREEYENEK